MYYGVVVIATDNIVVIACASTDAINVIDVIIVAPSVLSIIDDVVVVANVVFYDVESSSCEKY